MRAKETQTHEKTWGRWGTRQNSLFVFKNKNQERARITSSATSFTQRLG